MLDHLAFFSFEHEPPVTSARVSRAPRPHSPPNAPSRDQGGRSQDRSQGRDQGGRDQGGRDQGGDQGGHQSGRGRAQRHGDEDYSRARVPRGRGGGSGGHGGGASREHVRRHEASSVSVSDNAYRAPGFRQRAPTSELANVAYDFDSVPEEPAAILVIDVCVCALFERLRSVAVGRSVGRSVGELVHRVGLFLDCRVHPKRIS